MKRLFYIILSATLLAVSFPILADIEEPTISTRIVGGVESSPTQWPAMVSLKYKGYIDGHFCGASLIAQQWVLTAAHCMYDNQGLELAASDISATVSEYDLGSMPSTPSTDIELVLVHRDYDSATQVNDIALLKLAVPVMNENISIASLSSTENWIAQKSPATVIGWGSTVGYDPDQAVIPDPDYPLLLNEVEVQLMTDQQCTGSLGTSYSGEMICAGVPEGGKDACMGDSGGPLMVNSNDGWQQIGIVSWGFGCASADYPGVYTRLALYDNWINYLVKTYTTFSIPISTEFSLVAVNDSETKEITIENYSDSEANFTYEIEGSEYFSFDASGCETVAAHSSCKFEVTYAPLDSAEHTATITVNSDILYAIPQESELYVKPPSSGRSSGSLGFFTLLLIPLLFIRRSYP